MVRLVKTGVSLNVVLGDITEFNGDAIVNPANTYMIMGGGVAGAIKRRGGVEIELEARKHAPVPVGEAVTTSAGSLKCRFVIHAPTVETPGGRSDSRKVYEATKAALKEALKHEIETLAFPLMGAGVGGLTVREAVEAMTRAFREIGEGLEPHLYLVNEDTYTKVVDELTRTGWIIKEHSKTLRSEVTSPSESK